ncbi:MAG: bifunctional molybdenum cofactor biosynthesis protein MoaC/MoaB [Bacteroidetes bacterium]|nr:bifunctional molybdenum cofactor biosynthesis protein MoaC/MoaB [Bacteroidota bacterium]MCW5894982.1 bifunctional molybdenum cofactor biosynthesis protein MoaC/MoaB [Bacteroidota bacterium]
MRDISRKTTTLRTAVASARLHLSPRTIDLIHQNRIPKGNPLEVAKVAAIQAAKNTSGIIPYCHPLPIDFAGVEYAFGENWIDVSATVKAIYKTGVEMEALTAASVAALTMYDMLKMLDEEMSIGEIRLLKKTGGKSEYRLPASKTFRAAVLVMSDSIADGKGADRSGNVIVERLKTEGFEIADYSVIPDEKATIVEKLKHYADNLKADLVVTTGGTGLSPRDITPEATREVIDREAPGVAEAIRMYGQARFPLAMLSRACSGLRGKTLIVTLPGSPGAVTDGLDALFPAILHAFAMIEGKGH